MQQIAPQDTQALVLPPVVGSPTGQDDQSGATQTVSHQLQANDNGNSTGSIHTFHNTREEGNKDKNAQLKTEENPSGRASNDQSKSRSTPDPVDPRPGKGVGTSGPPTHKAAQPKTHKYRVEIAHGRI